MEQIHLAEATHRAVTAIPNVSAKRHRASANAQRPANVAVVSLAARSRPVPVTALFTAAQHVLHAAKEGAQALDLGDTSLKLRQLDRVIGPGAENRARALIDQLGRDKAGLPGGAFLNRGQRTQLFGETIGTANDIPGAVKLNAALEELTRTGVGLGQSFESAHEKSYAYAKAADAMEEGSPTKPT